MFLLKAFFTALFSFIALLLLVKMLGNKQVTQMTMFDYVIGITLGSIGAELAIADEMKVFLIVLVAMITYSLFALLISIVHWNQKNKTSIFRYFNDTYWKGLIYKKSKNASRLNDVLTLRNQGYLISLTLNMYYGE